MTREEILAQNAKSLDLIKNSATRVNSDTAPLYGYFPVEIFDCPPFTMFTNNDCPRVAEILYLRSFEPHSMKLWCRLAREATVVVDVGAHVGVYSLAAAALRSDVAIHAYEPNLFALTRLRINKLINSFSNISEHYQAIAHKKVLTTIILDSGKGAWIRSGANILDSSQLGDTVERTIVQAVSLDDVVEDLGPRGLIKIDVEGAEGFVFSGMTRHLAKRPDIILETFSQDACNQINAAIQPLGYNVFQIQEDGRRLIRTDALRPMNPATQNLNQFLTTRDLPDLD